MKSSDDGDEKSGGKRKVPTDDDGVEGESPHPRPSAESSPDDDPAEKKKEAPPPYQSRSYWNKRYESLSKKGEEEGDVDEEE